MSNISISFTFQTFYHMIIKRSELVFISRKCLLEWISFKCASFIALIGFSKSYNSIDSSFIVLNIENIWVVEQYFGALDIFFKFNFFHLQLLESFFHNFIFNKFSSFHEVFYFLFEEIV